MMRTLDEPAITELRIYPRQGFGIVVRDDQIPRMCEVLKTLASKEMAETWRDHAVFVKQDKEVKDPCDPR